MLSVASCCNILMAHVNNHDQYRSYIKALWMFFVTLLYIPDRLPFFWTGCSNRFWFIFNCIKLDVELSSRINSVFFCKFLVHSPCYYFWWYWLCLHKFSLAMLECNKLPNDSLICNHWMNVYDTFRLLLQSDLGSRFNIISHNYVIRKGTCFFVSVFFYDKLFF